MNIKRNIAFIDGQNLYCGIRDGGWKLDYGKFRKYLEDKYNVADAYYFFGFINEEYQVLYDVLRKVGFTIQSKDQDSLHESVRKGNIDAFMVFKIMHKLLKEQDSFDKIILVTADGDFYDMVKFLIEENRFEKVLHPTRKYASSLYKKLGSERYDFLENPAIKSRIGIQKEKGS